MLASNPGDNAATPQTPPDNPTDPANNLSTFRLLVEGSTAYAMFLLDPLGRIASWNEGARRIFGYEETEAIGQHAALIFTPEDIANGVPEKEMATAAREGRALDVRWHQRKNGSRFWADGIMERLSDEAGNFKGFAKVVRDATREKESAERLIQSEERHRTFFETIDVGFCLIEVLFDADGRAHNYRFLEANPAFERHTGLVGAVGKTVRELVPDLDDFWFRAYGSVAQTGEAVQFENHAPAMKRWFEVYALRVGPADEHKVSVLFTDISARKEAQEALRDAQTRLQVALSAGEIATWTFDVAANRVVADANLARLFSVNPDAAAGGELGVYLQAIHPDDRARVTEAIGEAVAHKNEYEAEYRVVLPDGSFRWLEARGRVERDTEGNAVSLPGVVVDITERVERERRERFLGDLTARVRALLDPDEVLYETAKAVGQFTNAHRCLYIEVDDDNDTLTIRRDFVQGEGVGSIAGTFPLDAFGPPIIESLRRGIITQSDDTESDPRLAPEHRATFRATNLRAFLGVPLHRAGRWVAILALHYAQPRAWTTEEAELLTAVTERTWLAVENADLFRETKQRAERESLLNQIGTAVRATLEPEAILQAAVSLLGQGLEVDRCYFVRYDQTRDTARVSPEWFRAEAGIEPLAGRAFQMSLYSVDRDADFKAGRTHVVDDVVAYDPEDVAPLVSLDIRSVLRVPIEAGSQMTALTVAMAHTPRRWTSDEIRLLENIASLLRSVLESAHAQQRERNIAQQLQDALQPPAPSDLPSLALASYYRPALAEASVGGDFFDVFPVEEGCTALVVADLSGKGLAAASQVATVRNMLRYAVYSRETLAGAVTSLHRILVEHDLLSGFATLFVGVYDEKQKMLIYVNCGQEPGLIFRAATGRVEYLPPTGSVLGGFGTGDYEERRVALSSGDVIALFTDGLTEVGPSRKIQLEVEGVSEVLRNCCGPGTVGVTTPQSVVDCLIAGVDDFGHGGVGDDIALLVGVLA